MIESPKSASDENWRALSFRVLAKSKGTCFNCGRDDRVRVKMIVPEDSGGRLTEANTVALCRPCDLAATGRSSVSEGDRKLVNFWVSRSLHDSMALETRFRSMGSMVRFLMEAYVEDETRYDDLEQYQDEGSDVKVNVWVDAKTYAQFKTLLDRRNMTVTDALKALICMYRLLSADSANLFGKSE